MLEERLLTLVGVINDLKHVNSCLSNNVIACHLMVLRPFYRKWNGKRNSMPGLNFTWLDIISLDPFGISPTFSSTFHLKTQNCPFCVWHYHGLGLLVVCPVSFQPTSHTSVALQLSDDGT